MRRIFQYGTPQSPAVLEMSRGLIESQYWSVFVVPSFRNCNFLHNYSNTRRARCQYTDDINGDVFMDVVMAAGMRHSRENFTIREGREAFAELVFRFFDREEWWKDRESPTRRLASRVTPRSPQMLDQYIEKGTAPGPEVIEGLERETGTPRADWEYALRYNVLPEDGDVTSTPNRVKARVMIDQLDDADLALMVDLGHRLLSGKEMDRRHGPRPITEEGSPADKASGRQRKP